jgi:hypothetical protein
LIGGGERMGEEVPPLAQQAVDLLGRQVVADLLKPLGIGAAEHTPGFRRGRLLSSA